MFITSSIGAMFAGASVVHHYYKPNLVSAVPLSVLVIIFDAYFLKCVNNYICKKTPAHKKRKKQTCANDTQNLPVIFVAHKSKFFATYVFGSRYGSIG